MNETPRRMSLAFMAAGITAMAASALWYFAFPPPSQTSQKTFSSPDAETEKSAESSGEGTSVLMNAMRRMQENENDVDALLDAARVLNEQGRAEAALSLAQKAAVAAPSDPRPPYFTGVILAGEKKWDEAVLQLERSISMKDDPSARYSAAVIYRYHLKQEDKAKMHFRMAAELCEDPALATMIKSELNQ